MTCLVIEKYVDLGGFNKGCFLGRCMQANEAVAAGQAVYSKRTLSLHDLWVLGMSNSYLWKCPTKMLRDVFQKNATLNHLDVGVGTGYYLDKCMAFVERRVGLLDLNENSLMVASSRISRFNPERYCGNVLEPIKLECDKFDSISINYLLHCLPGSIKEKSVLFGHLKALLNNDGVLFGSTILGKGSDKNYLATKLMAFYNKKGIFDNLDDDLQSLESSLRASFRNVDVRVEGCVAIFSAQL